MNPLLKVSPEEANDVATRVNNSIKRLLSHIKNFRAKNQSYAQKIKENTTREEEDLDDAMRKCNMYLKEVEGQVYDILSRHDSFQFKITVPDFKAMLHRMLQAYDREKFKTELAIWKFDSIPKKNCRSFGKLGGWMLIF